MLWEILNNCNLLDLFFFLKLRFNLICVHFHFSSDELDSMSSTERISFLQEKLQEIRKYYMTLKSEVASIDRRRKRLKKKEREGRRACRQTLTSSACFLRRALLHQYRLCLTWSQCCFLSVAISLIARSLKMAVLVFVKEMLSWLIEWCHRLANRWHDIIFESPQITWNPSWVGPEREPGTRYFHQIEPTQVEKVC